MRLGIEPRAALSLGDSDVDRAPARAAGMVALGAGWGFRGEAELRAAGAEAVLAAPSRSFRIFELPRAGFLH